MKTLLKNYLRARFRRLRAFFYSSHPFVEYRQYAGDMRAIQERLDLNAELSGRIAMRQNANLKPSDVQSINEVEFKVFSQFGEDGIIQFLIQNIEVPNPCFVEFGTADFMESNTRFLLVNNNWRGLAMDGSRQNIHHIRTREFYWRYNLQAKRAYITRDNINELIREEGMEGDIGLLSIDIGGNDYWVWKAIEVVQPRIVICEWNSVFGPKVCGTIKYDETFNSESRYEYHHTGLYSGASLEALRKLGREKGYQFVGSNINANNAFFLRDDLCGEFGHIIEKAGYIESQFRDSKDAEGRLNYLSGQARLDAIKHLEIYELNQERMVKIEELL